MEEDHHMLKTMATSFAFLVVFIFLKLIHTLWWRPRSTERILRKQGIKGTSYKLFKGDMPEMKKLAIDSSSKPISLNSQILPRVIPFFHNMVKQYGKVSVCWFGSTPKVMIAEVELIKLIFEDKKGELVHPPLNPLVNLQHMGLARLEGQQWSKRRRLISPAFHLDKLKMLNDSNDTEMPALSDETKLASAASEDRFGRWARTTFKIVLSYHGGSFDGWQKQPGLKTVQSIVEGSLGEFFDEKKVQLLKDKGLPIEGCAVVAGRTDKGVTGLGQVCSFYTWRKDVKPWDIEDAINHAVSGKLRVVSVSEVSRIFHPNFSAKWRRYLYIFPLTDDKYGDQSSGNGSCENDEYDDIHDSNSNGTRSENKSYVFRVRKVNQLLQQLEGKMLSYKMFARDTKASRNE